MKKIIIGAMLVALSAPVGMQDVQGRTTTNTNRNIVETVGQAYTIASVQALVTQVTEARAILAQIISMYQGVTKALSNVDPSYKDLLKTSFKADETTLRNLVNWFNTVINGSSEQDFRRLGNEVDKTICALNACRLVDALAARYEKDGIAKQQAPTSRMGKLKDKLRRGKDWLRQEYKEHKENKIPMLREKMEDARASADEILKTFDVNTATLEEVINLRQAVNNLYSAMNSYYSTSGTVDKYNAKDDSIIDDNIAKLKELSTDYQNVIKNMTRPEFNGSTKGNLVLRACEKVFDKLDNIKDTLTDESAIQERRPGFARKVAGKFAEETGKMARKTINKVKNSRKQPVSEEEIDEEEASDDTEDSAEEIQVTSKNASNATKEESSQKKGIRAKLSNLGSRLKARLHRNKGQSTGK